MFEFSKLIPDIRYLIYSYLSIYDIVLFSQVSKEVREEIRHESIYKKIIIGYGELTEEQRNLKDIVKKGDVPALEVIKNITTIKDLLAKDFRNHDCFHTAAKYGHSAIMDILYEHIMTQVENSENAKLEIYPKYTDTEVPMQVKQIVWKIVCHQPDVNEKMKELLGGLEKPENPVKMNKNELYVYFSRIAASYGNIAFLNYLKAEQGMEINPLLGTIKINGFSQPFNQEDSLFVISVINGQDKMFEYLVNGVAEAKRHKMPWHILLPASVVMKQISACAKVMSLYQKTGEEPINLNGEELSLMKSALEKDDIPMQLFLYKKGVQLPENLSSTQYNFFNGINPLSEAMKPNTQAVLNTKKA